MQRLMQARPDDNDAVDGSEGDDNEDAGSDGAAVKRERANVTKPMKSQRRRDDVATSAGLARLKETW